MGQLTLVSLYGYKNSILENFISSLHEKINTSSFSIYFNPYHIFQIHATIIGLERVIKDNYYNANLMHDKNIKAIMDFDQLSPILKSYFPMKVRIGGFDKSFNNFLSFGEKPYLRSFQISLNTNKIILIGWPHKNYNFNFRLLWDLRSKIEKDCNIRHKYAKDEDSDFSLVLGEIKPLDSISMNKIKKDIFNFENSIRQFLSDNPFDIEINIHDLKVAQYKNNTLPLDTTTVHEIENLTSSLVKKLY